MCHIYNGTDLIYIDQALFTKYNRTVSTLCRDSIILYLNNKSIVEKKR